jgi:hypothetical protein
MVTGVAAKTSLKGISNKEGSEPFLKKDLNSRVFPLPLI